MKKWINGLINRIANRSDILKTERAMLCAITKECSELKFMCSVRENEVKGLLKEVSVFADRMAKVSVIDVQERPVYRVCVDIDHKEVARFFEHGVSNGDGMRYIGIIIGQRAAEAIRQCNFVR